MGWLLLALLAAQGQAQECKPVSVDNNGTMRQAIFCRGTDGQWRERDSATQPEPLPADFQGVIVYEGEMDGIARLRPSNPNRRGEEVAYGGLVRYRAEYDGNLVTVKGEPIKAVNVGAVTLTGTRSGSTCTLFEANGSRLQVRCDRTGFAGTFSGTKPDSRGEWRLQHSIETVAVSVKSNADTAREQAQRAAERQKQEALAKEEQKAEANRELPVLWNQYITNKREYDSQYKIFRNTKKLDGKGGKCTHLATLQEKFSVLDKIFLKIKTYLAHDFQITDNWKKNFENLNFHHALSESEVATAKYECS